MLQRISTIMILAGCLSGCALLVGPGHDQTTRQQVTQSALRYLYPDANALDMAQGSVTHLQLPLRVGIAYIPAGHDGAPSFATQEQTLDLLAAHLDTQDFVDRAVVLPPGALTQSGGFEELERLSFLHRVDTMMLLSYEQQAFTEDTALSVLDFTVVGAFVVPGHRNEVQTRLTATTVHIPSQRYLFSANARHALEQQATLVHTPTQIRAGQADGLEHAARSLIPALDAALIDFKADLERDATLQVAGGSFGLPMLALGLLLLRSRFRP